MMTPLTEDNANIFSELAQHRYQKALELEKQLRVLIETKGPFDPNVRIIRNNIRESYEAIILEDHEFSELHDVEQSLWRLHYKRIEEFRARLRKSMSASAASSASPGTPGAMLASKATSRKEPQHKILAVFRSFLSEASGFYHDLILKVRVKHGLSQDFLPCEGVEGSTSSRDDTGVADLKRCQLSCHRCLIYLGDLARYKELHADGELASYDWSVAAGYYTRAASLWPSSGNPHNQLAVLATYVNDEMLAVYRYFRSLAADTPFSTARDNLILLFEKNRLHHLQLVASYGDANSSRVGLKIGDSNKGNVRGDKTLSVGIDDTELVKADSEIQVTAEGASSLAEALKNLRIRFVRLNGILFTRTSVETFSDVFAETLNDIERLFCSTYGIGKAGLNLDYFYMGGASANEPALALQLVTILIFSVHNSTLGSDTQQPTYAEVLQRSVMLQHAFTAAFHCAGQLMQKCADIEDASASPLLPAILVFIEWLACRPEMAVETEIEEKQANAMLFFWRKCTDLLNKLLDGDLLDASKEDSKGTPGHLNASLFQDEREWQVALWEDYELQGFTPLTPAQLALQYSKRPTACLGNKKERMIRVWRLIAASKAVASALEKSKKGIFYDEEMQRFYVAGDKPRRKSKNETCGVMLNDSHGNDRCEILAERRSVTDLKNENPQNVKEVTLINSIPIPIIELGEDEDEVIVFKPLMKGPQSTSQTSEFLQAWNMRRFDKSLRPGQHAGDGNAVCGVGQNVLPMLASQYTGMDKQISGLGSSSVSTMGNSVTTSTQNGMLPFFGTTRQASSITHTHVKDSDSSFLRASSLPKDLGSSVLDGFFTSTYPNIKPNCLNTSLNVASSGGGWPSVTCRGSTDSGASITRGIGRHYDIYNNRWGYSPALGNITGWSEDAYAINSSWGRDLQMLATHGLTNVSLGGPSLNFAEQASTSRGPSHVPSVFPFENTLGTVSQPFMTGLPTTMAVDVDEDSLHKLGSIFARSKFCNQALKVAENHEVPAQGQESEVTNRLNATAESISANSPVIKPATNASNIEEKAFSNPAGKSAIMRPPPGFGPLLGRPPALSTQDSITASGCQQSNKPVTSVPVIYSQSLPTKDKGEGNDLPVDDYRWLDGYTPIKREANKIENTEKVSSVDSLKDGIWSNAGNPIGDMAAFPFPGMRLSDRYTSPSQEQIFISQLQQQAFLQQHQKLLQDQQCQHLAQAECKKLEQYEQLYGIQLLHRDVNPEQQLQQQQLLMHQHQAHAQVQPLVYGQQNAEDPFVS